MKLKAFSGNGLAMVLHAGRDMHLKARLPRGARHGQPMRDEVPVLGHKVDKARGRHGALSRKTRLRVVRGIGLTPSRGADL